MEQEIKRALEVLKAGGTILYPTDTIWGIGCDATNIAAVKKVYEIKNREEAKSLILLVDEESKLNKYVKDVPAGLKEAAIIKAGIPVAHEVKQATAVGSN